MQWDINLCDLKTGTQAGVQASNLNESLGQIDYVFSDKTGTLTKNYMQFKKVSIGDFSYGHDKGLEAKEEEIGDFERADDQSDLLKTVLSNNSLRGDNQTVSNFNFWDIEFERHLQDSSHSNHKHIVNFLQHLAICHTIVIQQMKLPQKKAAIVDQEAVEATSDTSSEPVQEIYSAQSPDELALVNAAKQFGIKFKSRPNSRTIMIEQNLP